MRIHANPDLKHWKNCFNINYKQLFASFNYIFVPTLPPTMTVVSKGKGSVNEATVVTGVEGGG